MNKKICPKCKVEISNDFGVQLEFCTSCGFQLKQFTEAQTILKPVYDQDSKQPQKSFNSKYLIGCLGVCFGFLILSAMGLIGFWWFSTEAGLEHPDYVGKISVPQTQTLRYLADWEAPKTLDHQVLTYHDITPALFEGLAQTDNFTADIDPSLAEKWESNTDSTVWTFYLRKDAKWSDGEPITADDFVYSWRRSLDPKTKSRITYMLFLIKNGEEFYTSKATADDVGVKAIDDHTLQVTLNQPTPYFDKIVADDAFRPVPKQAIETHGENWTKPENIVTSGAFKLSEWTVDKRIVLERNPQFWDNKNTKLDRIIFLFRSEEEIKNKGVDLPVKLYENGEIDVTRNHTFENAPYVGKKDFIRNKLDTTGFISLNVKIKPLDDKRVRKALSLAIDRKQAIARNSLADSSTSFIPEIKGYKNASVIRYDPIEARRLLAEAGYPDGRGFPELEYLYNISESNKETAQNVQEQLKKELGITVTLKYMDFKEFLKVRMGLEYKGLARNGWAADYSDPFNFLKLMTDKENSSGWVDEKYIEMLRKSNLEKDEGKRYQLLTEAETYLLENSPVIPLSSSPRAMFVKPYVKDFSLNPLGKINWRRVYIDTGFTEDSL